MIALNISVRNGGTILSADTMSIDAAPGLLKHPGRK